MCAASSPPGWQPPRVAKYETPVWAQGLAVHVDGSPPLGAACGANASGVSAVADFDSVQLFDVSDHLNPVFCASLGITEPGIGDPVVKVALTEDDGEHFVLLATGDGATAIDITDLGNTSVDSSYETQDLGAFADSQDVAVDELRDLVYLPSWAGGLQILDEDGEIFRSHLLAPQVETTAEAAGTAFFTAVPCHEWICASEGTGGLQVVEFDDSAEGGLSRRASIPVGGEGDWAWDVVVDHCTAWVTYGNPVSDTGGLVGVPVPECAEQVVIPLAEPVPGDANGDGVVTTGDFFVWRSEFRASCTGSCAADFNGDGIVGTGDFFIWRDAFSQGP